MLQLSKVMKKRRVEEGAIELASTEVKFKLEQQTKDPTGIGIPLFYLLCFGFILFLSHLDSFYFVLIIILSSRAVPAPRDQFYG